MLHAPMKCNQNMSISSYSESYCFLLLYSYAIMIACWNSDPQERAKFASLTQQLSNLLEQEAGYLDLRPSLSWTTHRKPQQKACKAKPPVLQTNDEKLMKRKEECVEMKMKLKEGDEVNEKDSVV